MDETEPPVVWRLWQGDGSLFYSDGSYNPALPTAMFDFDSTLCPRFSRGPPREITLKFLARLVESFNIVIVSNQSGGKTSDLKEYAKELDYLTGKRYVTVYAALQRDRFRKPHTGTWEHFVKFKCNRVRPRFAFYCGDAAGRPGDHSAVDYMYALNIGIPFLTTESVFGGGGVPWTEPKLLGASAEFPPGFKKDAGADQSPDAIFGKLEEPCLIIMVGSPASGKSRIAERLSKDRGIFYVSSDKFGKSTVRIFQQVLAGGYSIIVDNTCPRISDRRQFAEDRLKQNHSVIICHVTTPKEICFHLNAARCQLDDTEEVKELPPVAIHKYWKHFEPPTEKEAEGYGGRLLRVNFSLARDAPPEVSDFHYPF